MLQVVSKELIIVCMLLKAFTSPSVESEDEWNCIHSYFVVTYQLTFVVVVECNENIAYNGHFETVKLSSFFSLQPLAYRVA